MKLERTTKKCEDGNYLYDCETPSIARNKLGKLEDSEERLGFDLIKFLDALENGIHDEKMYYPGNFLSLSCGNLGIYIDRLDRLFLFKDYGKTWVVGKHWDLSNEVIKIGKYTFKPVGVEGIYICNEVIFEAAFDEDGRDGWEISIGKQLLEDWFVNNATTEIKERFDIDLPTVEEVFSQKMLDLYGNEKKFASKQFQIFKDSDERMKRFEGKPTQWWTRTPVAGHYGNVWNVHTDGGIYNARTCHTRGFVPVLRKRPEVIKKNQRLDQYCLEKEIEEME